MFSYFEPNFIEKFLWESGFPNFGQKSKWREIKIGYLAAILKRYKIFKICLQNCDFFIVHTYMVPDFIAKFRWESSFLRLGP